MNIHKMTPEEKKWYQDSIERHNQRQAETSAPKPLPPAGAGLSEERKAEMRAAARLGVSWAASAQPKPQPIATAKPVPFPSRKKPERGLTVEDVALAVATGGEVALMARELKKAIFEIQ